MFYLKVFYKALLENSLWGIGYLLFSFILISLLMNQDNINDLLKVKLSNPENFSYFYVLVSAQENHADAAAKIRDLDEVKKVEMLSNETIKQEVKRILGELGGDTMASIINLDYVGLKVIFSLHASLKAQELVVEYVERLIGKNNLIMGDVRKNINSKTEEKTLIETYFDLIYPALIIISFIFWIISFWFVRRNLIRVCYLIEQYQRKKKVAVKSILSGTMSVFLISTLSMLLLSSINWLNLIAVLVLIFLLFLLSFKANTWEA